MSGVVNKSVADKAVAVKADELIRKPFQPQELIGRVKSLLEPKRATDAPPVERPAAPNALNSLFAPPSPPVAPRPWRRLPPLQNRELQSPSGRARLLRLSSHRVRWRAQLLSRICSHQESRPAGLLPRLRTYKSCDLKSPDSICSSRNCRRKCRLSGSIPRRSSFRYKR